MTDTTTPQPTPDEQPQPEKPRVQMPTVIENHIKVGDGRAWSILVTLLLVAGVTVLAYQLSLSGLADLAASAITFFVFTLVKSMFSAGILRMPEAEAGEDDFAFTKSALRKISDEFKLAIAKSSLLRLVLISAAITALFLLARMAAGALIGLMTSMWIAIGFGLILGALIVAQDQILAWARKAWVKKQNRTA
ncbi:hypothetical protein [Microbacterium sp.]|uniref:hypothetical protein n=1 Tax=Microbacterium sp. TaxID=51671 RepID=UPI00334046F2